MVVEYLLLGYIICLNRPSLTYIKENDANKGCVDPDFGVQS